jgi:hypothetical protein
MKQIFNPWEHFLRPERDLHALRIDPTHPLNLFWAINHDSLYMFVFEFDPSGSDATSLPELKGIKTTIVSSEGEGSRNRLMLTLADSTSWELFLALCNDLVESTRTTKPSLGLRFIIARLSKWQELFKKASSVVLSEEKIKGLLGELVFLKNHLVPVYGYHNAVEFWQGPTGYPQDFAVNGCAIEVKCHEGSRSSSIFISSADQLCSRLPNTYLFVYIISKSTSENPGSINLLSVVAEIRREIEAVSIETLAAFDGLLASVGYIDLQRYSEPYYVITDNVMYQIKIGFPRICSIDLMPGVSDVSYRIDLNQCDDFRGKPDWMVNR